VFKAQLKHCRAEAETNETDALVKDLMSKDFCKFWSKVKLRDKNYANYASAIDGACGTENICDHWENLYEQNFSRSMNCNNSEEEICLLRRMDNLCVAGNSNMFNEDLIRKAVFEKMLSKSCGPDELCAEHFRYAPLQVWGVLAKLFDACLAHCTLPQSIMNVNIMPIVKKRDWTANVVIIIALLRSQQLYQKFLNMHCWIF